MKLSFFLSRTLAVTLSVILLGGSVGSFLEVGAQSVEELSQRAEWMLKAREGYLLPPVRNLLKGMGFTDEQLDQVRMPPITAGEWYEEPFQAGTRIGELPRIQQSDQRELAQTPRNLLETFGVAGEVLERAKVVPDATGWRTVVVDGKPVALRSTTVPVTRYGASGDPETGEHTFSPFDSGELIFIYDQGQSELAQTRDEAGSFAPGEIMILNPSLGLSVDPVTGLFMGLPEGRSTMILTNPETREVDLQLRLDALPELPRGLSELSEDQLNDAYDALERDMEAFEEDLRRRGLWPTDSSRSGNKKDPDDKKIRLDGTRQVHLGVMPWERDLVVQIPILLPQAMRQALWAVNAQAFGEWRLIPGAGSVGTVAITREPSLTTFFEGGTMAFPVGTLRLSNPDRRDIDISSEELKILLDTLPSEEEYEQFLDETRWRPTGDPLYDGIIARLSQGFPQQERDEGQYDSEDAFLRSFEEDSADVDEDAQIPLNTDSGFFGFGEEKAGDKEDGAEKSPGGKKLRESASMEPFSLSSVYPEQREFRVYQESRDLIVVQLSIHDQRIRGDEFEDPAWKLSYDVEIDNDILDGREYRGELERIRPFETIDLESYFLCHRAGTVTLLPVVRIQTLENTPVMTTLYGEPFEIDCVGSGTFSDLIVLTA